MNPGDLRVAPETCGSAGCHPSEVRNVSTSMMTTGGMLWGAALYNNGGYPHKDTRFGESYARDGTPQTVRTIPPPSAEETRTKGVLPEITPLERWEISQPGNVLRVFERGGGPKGEVGEPVRADDAGKPDDKLSTRGFGTQLRTDPVFLGLQKTRLLDPLLSLPGTNDQPGDYRASGCTACHVVYANDRSAEHSAQYAPFGNRGFSATNDPTIPREESGHPIRHEFTRSIPSSQCMVCHVHPGTNMVTTYFGYTWWDNESDGDAMYPKAAAQSHRGRKIRGVAAQSRRRGRARAVVRREISRGNGQRRVQRKIEGHAVRRFSQPRLALPRGVRARPAKATCSMKKEPRSLLTIRTNLRRPRTSRTFTCKRACSAWTATSSRTATAPENFTASRAPRSKSTASIATARFRSRATLVTSGPAAPGGGTHLDALRTPWRERRFEWRDGKLYPALHDGPAPRMGSGADARLDHAGQSRTTTKNRAWRKRCAPTA